MRPGTFHSIAGLIVVAALAHACASSSKLAESGGVGPAPVRLYAL